MIRLTTQHPERVYLKELLQENCLDISSTQLSIQLSIESGVSITLYDNLIDVNKASGNAKHQIEFIVHEDGILQYYLHAVPALQQVVYAAPDKNSFMPALHDKALIEKDLTVRLVGKNAQANLHCTCYGSGDKVFKFTTLQDHQVADTKSDLLIKSVLDDNAKITCNSMIHIRKDAQHAVAELNNKNIVLSKKARVVSIPQLEIEANDVVCKHGAAISTINDEQVFYLQSRGIDALQTRKMLIEAFLQ